MKAKRVVSVIFAVLFSIVFIAAVGFGIFLVVYTPTLTADFSVKTGEVTDGASGYLYGIAQNGVPSETMTDSVDISTVSQKVTGGLQHPVGDISDVETQLTNTDYNVVYLQDSYDTWYYANDDIMAARKAGEYDWQKFISEDYFPRVEKAVKTLSASKSADKTVYCLYNECDNGVWFGTTVKDRSNEEYGVGAKYDKEGRENFYSAWKQTYDLVRSIDPDALIGGPGFYEYDHDKISSFLEYCKENNCLPDIMIYHELADNSVYLWQDNVADYRQMEKDMGMAELPIIVTEYGRMKDNGLPGKMVQYITQIETSKVYADNAFWRLANNLCDVAADDNCPNSNWWLYRWYTDMQGSTVQIDYNDLFRSNVGKWLSGNAPLRSQGFMGVVTITDDNQKIEAVCGGRSGDAELILDNLDAVGLDGKKVGVYIEESVYQGLSGVVNSPVCVKYYTANVKDGSLEIKFDKMDEGNAYHVIVSAVDIPEEDYENSNLPLRFEAEEGDLLGTAYTYESAYATTGEKEGMVGGIESEGSGVKMTIKAPADGDYVLQVIYGKANDGKDSDDRKNGKMNISIDGKNTQLDLSNTIKSEYTDYVSLPVTLTEGKHTVEMTYADGTFVVDSVLLSPSTEEKQVYVFADPDYTSDEKTAFLAVAENDGYYELTGKADTQFTVFDAQGKTDNEGKAVVYLRRGLNTVVFDGNIDNAFNLSYSSYGTGACSIKATDEKTEPIAVLKPADFSLAGGAKIEKSGNTEYITGITSSSGSASVTVNAPESGKYFITITYANNDEGGYHDYNVDLVERYVTINCGSDSEDVWCRNTYCWDTYKTVTAVVQLKKGSNKLTLTNSGNTKFNGKETEIPRISSISVEKPVV